MGNGLRKKPVSLLFMLEFICAKRSQGQRHDYNIQFDSAGNKYDFFYKNKVFAGTATTPILPKRHC